MSMRQAWHGPSHAESQHTPSARNPEAQSAAVDAEAPSAILQSPTSLQLFPSRPAHVSGSSRFCTSVHLPGLAPAHVWHVPQAATLQQTLSVQNAFAPTHCSLEVHVAPSVVWSQVSSRANAFATPPKSTSSL